MARNRLLGGKLLEQSAQRFRVYENAGPPPPNSGPPSKWGYLPLETVGVGDLIEVTLEADDAKSTINAIRSHAGRLARRTDKKFSVRITDYGIGIWRTK
jgi:hypothetical protein